MLRGHGEQCFLVTVIVNGDRMEMCAASRIANEYLTMIRIERCGLREVNRICWEDIRRPDVSDVLQT